MRFASLGSGSDGNALVVEAGATRVLVDCGFGVDETERRLARLGLAPAALAGILVTHEHGDHADGAGAFARRHGLGVWMTHGTLRATADAGASGAGVTVFASDEPFALGDIEVSPFPVPHDAREPVQFVLGDGARRLGVLTDLGASTRHVEAMLSRCDALVLECNHDERMLADGRYPGWLKARIAGPFGHLANAAAAALLAALDCSRLRHVIAAHLSAANNRPELARAALAGALGCDESWIGIADQARGFDWREL
ncbi:MAG: MBL fold metallo-hydrolase [Burkholderiales bacterium]